MDTSIIAVRVANGTFVPILDTSSATRRRLVLTTIRDNQTSVQIDLYRGADETMGGAQYVGSLMIENIEAAPKGEADIALLLGVDENGNLNATATDKKSGEYQSLSVGLESIEQGSGYDLPDFELSDEELTLDDISVDEEELELEESAASLELNDVNLEEDLTLDVEDGPASDTLAAPGPEPGEELAGLEAFSEESIALDDSLSDESLGDIELGDDEFETVEEEESEADFATENLPELGDELVESELGEEDFTFDEVESEEGEELEEPDENLFEEIGDLEDGGETEETFDELSDSGMDTEFDAEEDFAGEDFSTDQMAATDSFPDFDAESGETAVPGAYGADAEPLTPRRSNPLIFVGYIILSLAALGVLTYLIFRLLEGPPAPPLRAVFPLLALPRLRRRERNQGARATR